MNFEPQPVKTSPTLLMSIIREARRNACRDLVANRSDPAVRFVFPLNVARECDGLTDIQTEALVDLVERLASRCRRLDDGDNDIAVGDLVLQEIAAMLGQPRDSRT